MNLITESTLSCNSVLVTGGAGFIGFHLTKALLAEGVNVIGVDNLNDYYDPALKKARLDEIYKWYSGSSPAVKSAHQVKARYKFIKLDIANKQSLTELFNEYTFDVVVNLAAQAGVRYSIDNPDAYVESNLVGFVNILEACRHNEVKHLVYASSSSVYGANTKQPFSIDDPVDHPISLYAATKRSNELMAHTYSHLFELPTTGLRFFTVYGPWGRPDMAYFKFTKAILNGDAIDVYNHGQMQRDFTYIDDIVDGILRVIERVPTKESSETQRCTVPYQLYNIGNNQPITLRKFISAIEEACDKKAIENPMEMQPGDVPLTYADISELASETGFNPSTDIDVGIMKFVDWYRDYFDIKS